MIKQMKIGNRNFVFDKHTYVMGILNITPDSFSDGGKFNQKDAALIRAQQMIEEGADIIDIGGESTRSGYTLLSDEEEIERVVPVIEAIKSNFDIPLSIDTYKSKVAGASIAAGVDLINDIWGLKYDKDMAKIIAESNIFCCLMHNRTELNYHDFIKEVLEDLSETIQIAHDAGITDDNIILDPGVGFAKTYENNLQIINSLETLKSLGYPILLGTSRKSVIGQALDLPSGERIEGTLVTTILGVIKGCSFVRVHDIKENVRAIKMAEAILESGNK